MIPRKKKTLSKEREKRGGWRTGLVPNNETRMKRSTWKGIFIIHSNAWNIRTTLQKCERERARYLYVWLSVPAREIVLRCSRKEIKREIRVMTMNGFTNERSVWVIVRGFSSSNLWGFIATTRWWWRWCSTQSTILHAQARARFHHGRLHQLRLYAMTNVAKTQFYSFSKSPRSMCGMKNHCDSNEWQLLLSLYKNSSKLWENLARNLPTERKNKRWKITL